MHEEQDTCRICSGPAEPDQPLFYPCKCSGTIRYIHQDCLTTWLAHSKKKTCDVCKYPYSFTKVYSPTMPERLPVILLLKQFFRQALSLLVFGARAILVACIWLAFLPWATIWTWRMYFAMGTSTARWISNRPSSHQGLDIFSLFAANGSTPTSSAASQTSPQNATSILSHPTIHALSSDIVSGQIIASLIVLAFVAIFLLREWISQNARPGIFEDIIGEQDVPPPPPIPPQRRLLPPPRAPMNQLAAQPQPRRGGPVIPAAINREAQPRNEVEGQTGRDLQPVRRGKGKGKSTALEARGRPEDESQEPARRRRRQMSSDSRSSFDSSDVEKDLTGSHHRVKHRRSYRRAHTLREPRSSREHLELEPFQDQFTFTADPPSYSDENVPEDSSRRIFNFRDASPKQEEVDSEVLESSLLAPETDGESIASSSALVASSSSQEWQHVSTISDSSLAYSATSLLPLQESFAIDAMSTPGGSRRPPLPSATLSGIASPSTSPPQTVASRGHTPLASPGLASYRAPEELNQGEDEILWGEPSASSSKEEDREAEFRHFWRDPEESEPMNVDEQAGDDSGDYHDDETDVVPWSDDEYHDGEDDEPEAIDPPQEDGRLGENPPLEGDADGGQGAGGRPPDVNDELEANVEDDMDGALEAIGLRGPIHNVLQNAALMIFILDATIAVGVWLPFTIGKSVALLSLEPRRALQILHLPLRLIRFITDPVVDFVIYLISHMVLPPIYRTFQRAWDSSISAISTKVGHVLPGKALESLRSLEEQVGRGSVMTFRMVHEWLNKTTDATSEAHVPASWTSSSLDKLLEHESVAGLSEQVFAPLGKQVRDLSEVFQDNWFRFATGNGPNEKVFAVMLGYVVVGLALALYLNVLTVGNVQSAGRAVRNAVRQQLLVVKVAAFIIIELVIFPLGCGIMLDLCTVWLFPYGSFSARVTFVWYAPITAIFYHWVVGTMFMYQFAVLLAGCRGIMRPGAMWFIKDPQDQNFHPIRDILERPTLVQIRKLLLSAVMYSLVIAIGVGTISGILQVFSRTIMPLRWKIHEPLSAVPIDLLFLHVVLPYTMHYFRPKKALRQFGIYLWKYLSKHMRLTSYMFGGRYPSEEFTPKHWSWRRLFMKIDALDIEMDDAEAVHDGGYRRVPNSDNIVLVKDSPATVIVDADGNPVDDAQLELLLLQNAEAEKAKRNVKDDYMVVYLPPHFRYRIAGFILCLWIVGSIMLTAALAAPILLGRAFFRLAVSYDVHDGYSFIIGFYLIWACWLVGLAVDRLDKRRQRRDPETRQAEWPLYLAKRSLLWIAKTSYMVVFLGIVIPTLIGLAMELYVVLPAKYAFNVGSQPRIRIVDMWSLGLLYVKILLRAQRLGPNHRIVRGVEQITRNGWTRPDPFSATTEVIAPLILGLLGMILLPAASLWGLRQFIELPIGDDFIFLYLYPSIFTAAALGHGTFSLSKLVASWSQTIRDKEFLVEMRLRNIESDIEPYDPDKDSKSDIAVEDDDGLEEEQF